PVLLERVLQLPVLRRPGQLGDCEARERLLDGEQLTEVREHELALRLDLRRHVHQLCHQVLRCGCSVAVPRSDARSRCGSTVYLGSRADWKPALKTDQRSAASPARTSAPPAIAA